MDWRGGGRFGAVGVGLELLGVFFWCWCRVGGVGLVVWIWWCRVEFCGAGLGLVVVVWVWWCWCRVWGCCYRFGGVGLV